MEGSRTISVHGLAVEVAPGRPRCVELSPGALRARAFGSPSSLRSLSTRYYSLLRSEARLVKDLGQLVQLRGDAALLPGDVGDGGGLDRPVAHHRHHAPALGQHQVVGGDAHPGGPDPVVGRGGPAALGVSEHRGPGLMPEALLDHLGQRLGDAALAQLGVSEGVDLAVALLLIGDAGHLHALCAHDDAEVVAALEALLQAVDDLLEGHGDLGDQDEVRTTGQASHQGHPTGVPAHHLDHHHPVVRGGGGVEAVERLGNPAHRGVEADAVVGDREVVVHRLGDADHLPTVVRQPGGHREGVIAADGDQGSQLGPAQVAQDLLAAALALHGVGARASQHGTAQLEDAREETAVQLDEVAVADQACPSVLDTNDSITVGQGTPSHPADGRVEPGSVTAPGKDADAQGQLPYPGSWLKALSSSCPRTTITPSAEPLAPGLGGGSVVTETPKYAANHLAAAVSVPPLRSMTSVTEVVGTRPRSWVVQPNSPKMAAHRVEAPSPVPLPSSKPTLGSSPREFGGAKTFWMKWSTVA